MLFPIQIPQNNSLIQIVLLILVLVVAWVLLRFVLRLASRIFTLGCLVIVIIGVALFFLRYLR